MSAKPTGLAAFTGSKVPAETASEAAAGARKRGEGETVALTVRVSRADWARLHQLAVARGVSLQAIAISGLSAELAKDGLPALTPLPTRMKDRI